MFFTLVYFVLSIAVTKADNNSTSTSVVTETTQTTSQTTILTTEGFSLNVTDHISTNPNFFMSTMSSSHSVAAVFRICTMPVPDVAWQVVIMLTIVLATISICLLAHLLFFHLDLSELFFFLPLSCKHKKSGSCICHDLYMRICSYAHLYT